MTVLSPAGAARLRFLEGRPERPPEDDLVVDDEAGLLEPWYLGWEIARCARGLDSESGRALAALAAACIAGIQAGSTRIPVDEARLPIALETVGRTAERGAALALLGRARGGDPADPVSSVIGRPGDRRPLVLEGDWLSTERTHGQEVSFCQGVRARLDAAGGGEDIRAGQRAASAVAEGPPRLTGEQKRAVREAMTRPLALVTGGPGTGKTTVVVSLLRALAWAGVPMAQVAVAAPTGKAAKRLEEAITAGLAPAARDIVDAALVNSAPPPQTLHRLLGWSPSAGRFARHEGDPLPCRVVIVDEASMIDLALMDRLLRATRPDAHLVLLGDADQLPSIEAGAVFRDLCATLGAVRLTANLRVTADPAGKEIVDLARAVNSGSSDGVLSALKARRGAAQVAFEGAELVAAEWDALRDELLDRWLPSRPESNDLAQLAGRTYPLASGLFGEDAAPSLDALLDHHQRARFLCATRSMRSPTGAQAISRQLLERWRLILPASARWSRRSILCPGAPVLVERNDYARGLYNGDLGLVVLADAGCGSALFGAFKRRGIWSGHPLESLGDLPPAFAMTVHKAQGSEHDAVVVVLPDEDLPLVTREWVYTAVTRARRSVLIVGDSDLLARAVCRRVDRYSGIPGKLAGMKA